MLVTFGDGQNLQHLHTKFDPELKKINKNKKK